MKTMILHRDFNYLGGIENYYSKLRGKFNGSVEHFIMGRRIGESGGIKMVLRLFRDYVVFVGKLISGKHEIVHINPTMEYKSFVREGVFQILAKLLRRKTIVFWRGWHPEFEKKLEEGNLRLFKFLYGRTDAFIVLANAEKSVLRSWGCKQPIYNEVTVADDTALAGYDIEQILISREKEERFRLLFAARIFPEKGIYEAIDALTILHKKYEDIELVVCGSGDAVEPAKKLVAERGLSDHVRFPGYVMGEEKYKIYKSCHVAFLPTKHYEGLSNSMVEAIALGMPCVTRGVGGIIDFFRNEKNGFITDSTDPQVFAGFIERLYLEKDLYKAVSRHNYEFGQNRLMAHSAASRLETIYTEVNKES